MPDPPRSKFLTSTPARRHVEALLEDSGVAVAHGDLELAGQILRLKLAQPGADRGIVRLRAVMSNQQQQEVLGFIANVMFRRRASRE